ncbi:hypothetical protein DF185_04280 [Marinifilum breve]|uniref:UspA domain-containing protein n=1 Tax=Marinifilum breve TaxID=2184082 RepID=A0A2V4A020_9BACT|nr:hypothetical protein [Marinifilum breve]PXY01873.1 hypothetical protein DF185_04280 [Marinifilum breve]
MENRNKNQNRILILADFSEGNQTAIDFAMNYLCTEGSKIYFIQTWQKPSYGASMVRDLAPILKDISKRELQALKAEALKNYKLDAANVELLSYEGELTEFFNTEIYKGHSWQVVFALNELHNDLNLNPRFKKIIASVNQPLYVLNNCKPWANVKSIYISNTNSNVSEPILQPLQRICAKQKCNVHIGLDINDMYIHDKANLVKLYSSACTNASIRFENLSKDHKPELKRDDCMLWIYNEKKTECEEKNLISYFDKWFVKSKGITVGNF